MSRNINKIKELLSFITAILLLCTTGVMAAVEDDTSFIVDNMKRSLPIGMVSVEQHTGHLLFSPVLNKLNEKKLKEKFLIPGMVVNQKKGLHLINEFPFSCFLISAGELGESTYKSYRQHETLKYIREVKNFQVSRVMICQLEGIPRSDWKKILELDDKQNEFIFEDYVSITGDHFYYFINMEGSFDMYFTS